MGLSKRGYFIVLFPFLLAGCEVDDVPETDQSYRQAGEAIQESVKDIRDRVDGPPEPNGDEQQGID